MNSNIDEKKHLARIENYKKKVKRLFNKAVKDIATIVSLTNVNPDKPFQFQDYPTAQKKANKLFADFSNNLNTAIINGVRSEWTYANNQNNEMFNLLFSGVLNNELSQYNKLQSINNLKALKQFILRKNNGLNLSQRVWNIVNAFQNELELALSVGIGEGNSAQKISQNVRMYLNEPNKLFRRVRDQYGNLVLSQNAKAYHPGQGVYRSSYKNAIRLTATETNIAYRTSNYNRWQNESFVLGIEIELSNNHTLNGKPFFDMCDELQGKYPKDFKWVGWHPLCRCHATPILDEDDFFGFLKNDYTPKGVITDVPDNFKKWIAENGERYANYKNVPYFITDNPKYIK